MAMMMTRRMAASFTTISNRRGGASTMCTQRQKAALRISKIIARQLDASSSITVYKRSTSSHAIVASSLSVPNRGYIEITGKDATKFLQGICTNDITKLVNHGDCLAAAFLTTKGRILADAILYNVLSSPSSTQSQAPTPTPLTTKPPKRTIVIETHASAMVPLVGYLKSYKLRSAVTIKDATNHYCTSIVLGNVNPLARNLVVSAPDPRSTSLGIRLLMTMTMMDNNVHNGSGQPLQAGATDKTTNHNEEVKENHYRRFRLLNGLAEGPEISNRIPLECNMDLLHYIDFGKGCYVGQELIARTKFKGLVRKRLLPFVRASLLSSSSATPAGLPFAHSAELHLALAAWKDNDNESTGGSSSSSSSSNSSSSNSIEIEDLVIFSDLRVGSKLHLVAAPRAAAPLAAPASEPSAAGAAAAAAAAAEEPAHPAVDATVGEVVALSAGGDAGIALCRLAEVIPKSPEEHVPLLAAFSDAPTSETQEAVLVFRPQWWQDVDPITGNRVDTHDEEG